MIGTFSSAHSPQPAPLLSSNHGSHASAPCRQRSKQLPDRPSASSCRRSAEVHPPTTENAGGAAISIAIRRTRHHGQLTSRSSSRLTAVVQLARGIVQSVALEPSGTTCHHEPPSGASTDQEDSALTLTVTVSPEGRGRLSFPTSGSSSSISGPTNLKADDPKTDSRIHGHRQQSRRRGWRLSRTRCVDLGARDTQIDTR